MLDDETEFFKKISFFLEHISQADPQVYWQLKTQNHQFFCLFIAPGPTQEVFCWCRSFLALNGTFWKTCWNLILLLAVTMDEDNQILPLAWGIVSSESTNYWTFFLSHFHYVFSIDDTKITAINNWSKDLDAALSAELSHAIHAYLLSTPMWESYKIISLWQSPWVIWKTARAWSEIQFKEYLETIQMLHKNAAEYLEQISS